MRDTFLPFVNRILDKIASFAFLFTVLIVTYLPHWQNLPIRPQLLSVCFYHWTLYRPDLLPAGLMFVLGCLQDALQGYPLGISSLKWMILYGLLLLNKHHFIDQPFRAIWGGFVLWSLADSLLTWGLFSYLKGKWLSYGLILPEVVLTIALYPLWVFCLIRVQHKFFKS